MIRFIAALCLITLSACSCAHSTRLTTTTGYSVDVPAVWERIPNSPSLFDNAYEKMGFIDRSVKNVVTMSTIKQIDPQELIYVLAMTAHTKLGLQVSDPAVSIIPGSYEFMAQSDEMTVWVLAVNGPEYTYVFQCFGLPGTKFSQSTIDLLKSFKLQ